MEVQLGSDLEPLRFRYYGSAMDVVALPAGHDYDELGLLMVDFCESDPDRIRDGMLRKRVQYLKRDPEGVREMRRISEETYNEGRLKGIGQGARDNLV